MGEKAQKRESDDPRRTRRRWLTDEISIERGVDMTRNLRFTRLAVLSLAAVLGAGAVLAQGSGGPRPDAVESAPLPPPVATQPSGGTQGGVTLTQPSPSSPPSGGAAPAGPRSVQASPGTAPAGPARPRPTLVPKAGDPLNVDEVTLSAKPTAVLAGTSTWDDGFTNLKNAFRTIEEELVRSGLAPAGRPLTMFIQTDDMSFQYEAMVPIDRIPEGRARLTPDIRFGRTPDGKAYRFVHKGPYDDIDSTYETITAYLDDKGIIAKDTFLEEYATDLTEPTDDNLEINIFVLPR
jgi:effector-binding domain-containing protein